jgi:hypothetical protein
MKKLALLLGTGLACAQLHAAILIGPDGSGTLAFSTTPVVTEFATAVLNGTAPTFTTLDAAVNTVAAGSNFWKVLPTSATLPPSAFSGGFRHNNNAAGLLIQSRPTTDATNAANILLATLQNDSGGDISALTISYSFATTNLAAEEIVGFHVYWSLTGAPGTWTLIPGLSDTTNGTSHAASVAVGTWLAGSTMYLLWADDNAAAGDGSYMIDNMTIVPGGTVPLSVALTAPGNGLYGYPPTNITVSATTAGDVAATSVSFFTNGVLAATDTIVPFSTVLSALPPGIYAIHAEAINGVDPTAVSATNTIRVLNVINYTGGTHTENFDGMGDSGTTTPTGWYVGNAPPAISTNVTVGDGSAGPAGAVLGWNYGTTLATDRALGTCPTGTEKNMVAVIQNNSGSAMTTLEIHFTGEVWRNYTNPVVVGVISNLISMDLGATWVPTGLKFEQPFPPAEPPAAVDGNAVGNRTEDINAVIPLPSPLASGSILLVRWWDANEGGTDGGLAIDDVSFTGGFGAFVPFAILTTPTNGATFAEAAPITLAATASMATTITNIEFFHDGISIGSDTNAPFSAVYSNATVGSHTLTATAQAADGSSVSTTNTVIITVNPNVPPTITITNPASGSEYLVGTTVTNVSASAADSDGSIARVEFFVNDHLMVSDTTSPYGLDLCNLNGGSNTILAVAVDNAGSRVTNSISLVGTNLPGVTSIVTNGANWQYLDNGSDQSNFWHALDFDDSGWSNGVAELGYGDAPGRPERTTVGFGPSGTTKYATTYFRKKFLVTDPNAYTNFILRVLADDHFIVHLNGVLVFHNVTNTAVENVFFNTYTPAAIAQDGTLYTQTNLASSAFVAGTNIVAVEVHQDDGNSSDISFDLMIWAEGTAAGPRLTIVQTDATHVQVSWGSDAINYTLQTNAGDIGTPGDWNDYGTAITGAGSVSVAYPPPDRLLFRLKKP